MQKKAPTIQYTPGGVKTGDTTEGPAPKPKVEVKEAPPPELTVVFHKGKAVEISFKNWESLTPRMIAHSWRTVHKQLLITRQAAIRAAAKPKEITDGRRKRHWD